MITEKTLRLAARMYECRDTTRFLYGAEYEQKIEIFRSTVRGAMDRHKCGALEAVLKLLPDASPMHKIILTAAAVDLAEGVA